MTGQDVLPAGDAIEDDEYLGKKRNYVVLGRMSLVDLAGSERIKKTGAIGEVMKEGINIKTGTILVLATMIIILQVFWKYD